jgi:hypothetical protein
MPASTRTLEMRQHPDRAARMKLVLDDTDCRHNLDTKGDLLELDGRIGLRCSICNHYVFRGTDRIGNRTGDDRINRYVRAADGPGPNAPA